MAELQATSVLDLLKMLVRKTSFRAESDKMLVDWLDFRPFVLISALADCKCSYIFTEEEQMAIKIPLFLTTSETAGFSFFKTFYIKIQASIASPCVVL